MLTVPGEPAKTSWAAAARPRARTRPASGCSSSAWPSSCASTPATSSGEPARCTSPRVRMIWPPGTAKALTSAQSSTTTRTGMRLVGGRGGEALGEPVEGGAAGRRLARLAVLRHRGDDVRAERLARLLRHHARQAPGPDAARAATGRRRRRPRRPPRRGPAAGRCQRWRAAESAGARASSRRAKAGSATNSVSAPSGSQAQQHVGRVRRAAARCCAAAVGPQPRAARSPSRAHLEAAVGRGGPATGAAAATRPSLSAPAKRVPSEGVDIERLRQALRRSSAGRPGSARSRSRRSAPSRTAGRRCSAWSAPPRSATGSRATARG